MVKVPVYGGLQVTARPEFQQHINVQANPSAFGADIGQGMQNVGRGMGQAAEVMGQLAAFDDTQRAKDADTKFANWSRERMYGEGGYMTTEGRNAVDGRAAFESEAEQKRKEFGKDLTPGAAREYDRASQARVQSIYDTSVRHSMAGRKQWFNDAAAARLDTFSEDALAAYSDPKKVDFNIAAGQAEIRQQGQMLGWDADTTANKEKEFISSTRLNVALRQMVDDPTAAKKYYDEHKDQLTGPHQFKFDEAIKVPLTQANVLRHTDGFFNGAGGADYYASIRAAESSGNDAAKNPASTATGRYQFIQGTWDALRMKYPGLGLSSDGRTDPAQQERAIRAFTADNAKALARGGINVTNGALYAAHFLGAGGAVSVLRGDPAALVSDLVGEAVVKANGFLRGMSVAQFAAWADRKAGGGGSAPVGGGGSAPAGGGPMDQYNTINAYLQTITNPTEREMTRKAIYAQLDTQAKAQKAQTEAYTAQAYNLIETQNINPFDLPANVKTGIGMEGMSSLMTYWEKRAKEGEIKTDAMYLHDLRMMSAENPERFAEIDLFNYKGVLSKDDFEKVSGWKAEALKGVRSDEGQKISSAMSFAKVQMDAVGLSTSGLKNGSTAEKDMNRRIAQFQMALADEMEAYKKEHKKSPQQEDIQKMVNRMLLPIVMKQPGTFWDSKTEGFLFEAANRPDDSTVEVVAKITDIPIDLRRGISNDLQVELGRKPTDEEVISRYEFFTQNIQPVERGGAGPSVWQGGAAGLPIEYDPGAGPSMWMGDGGLKTPISSGLLGSPNVPGKDRGPSRSRSSSVSENDGIYFDGMTQNGDR